MTEIGLIIEYLAFATFCAIGFWFCRQGPEGRQYWKLKPSLLFVASFALYTSAMPFSRIFGLSDIESDDGYFLFAHILAAAGICLGLYLAKGSQRPSRNLSYQATGGAKAAITLTALAATALLIWQTWYFVGYNAANLLERYRFEQEAVETEFSTWNKLAIHAVSSTCCFGLLIIGAAQVNRKYRMGLYLAVLGASAIMLVRGNRNPFILIILPFIGIAFRNRRFPAMRAILVIAGAYLLFQTIAIIRNVGLGHQEDAEIRIGYYDPLRSELGTSYNVWQATKATPFFDRTIYGKSIFITTVLNLVPSAIWPNRPQTAAAEVSFYYFESGGNEVFGLGYSPVMEAMINFTIFGVFPWFAVLAFALARLESRLERGGVWANCSLAGLLPIVVNFQRIDMAVAVKLYLIFVGFFFVLAKIFRSTPWESNKEGREALEAQVLAAPGMARPELRAVQ